MNNILDALKYIFNLQTLPERLQTKQTFWPVKGVQAQTTKPTPTMISPVVPTRTPTPTQTPVQPTREELIQALTEGLKGKPLATMSAQMVDEGQKYPMFQKNPFLVAGHSQLESRALQDFQDKPNLVNKPKQAFGYGALVPDKLYNPKTVEEAMTTMMNNVGQRKSYYAPYRDQENLDLKAYANTYAGPQTARNPYAGDTYAKNLAYEMNKFAILLDAIMKSRGGSYQKRY